MLMGTAEQIMQMFGYDSQPENEVEATVGAARRAQLIDILREYGREEYEHGYWQARYSYQDWRE